MAIDLTGLAALSSSIPGGFLAGQQAQQRIKAAQLENVRRQQLITAQQQEDSANVAAGLGLIDGSHSAVPAAITGSSQPGSGGASSSGGSSTGTGTGSRASTDNPLSPYSIAARIKARNPGIKPDALFRAVGATIKQLGPLAQSQYREDMLNLRMQMQQQTLEERIREANNRLQQGADRMALQQDALNIRMQIAQMQQQGVNDRATQRLQQQLNTLVIKLTNKAGAAGSDAEYRLASTQRQEANTKINDIIRENGGILPAPGTPGRGKYDTLVKERDAAAKKMEAARKANPKLPGFNAAKNTLDEPAAGASALPSDLPDPKGIPEGTQAKDDSGKVVAVIKGGQWAAPGPGQ